jgi:similar to stage IV sporulation protein
MFLIKLYHFIFGYVIIKINGVKPERFVNMLMNLRVKFWGIQKISNDELRLKIPSRYAKENMLNQTAAKTHTEFNIISKKGIKYFIERRKYRLGIYVGVIIGVILIYISTFFIWEVKVVKSDYPNENEIIELLEQLGCKVGVLKKSIDTPAIQNKAILNSNGKITWISINIKGTVANIDVKKRPTIIDIVDQKTPVNIIAAKSGKIVYIGTYEGQQIVEPEKSVQKGALLISGAVHSINSGMRIKHASGIVLAETTRIIEIFIPLVSEKKYYTGIVINKNNLNILNKNINLYMKNTIPIEKYDKKKNTKNITLFDAVVLPVKISTTVYKEFTLKNIKIDENTAKDIAISKINCIIDSRFDSDENIVEIKSKNYEGEIKDDHFYMKCTVGCVENIAQEMPFGTNLSTEK